MEFNGNCNVIVDVNLDGNFDWIFNGNFNGKFNMNFNRNFEGNFNRNLVGNFYWNFVGSFDGNFERKCYGIFLMGIWMMYAILGIWSWTRSLYSPHYLKGTIKNHTQTSHLIDSTGTALCTLHPE